MSTPQRLFVISSWLFITLAALLFLVPTNFESSEGAAWVCLGVGVASHLALLGAIIYEQVPGPANPPAAG